MSILTSNFNEGATITSNVTSNDKVSIGTDKAADAINFWTAHSIGMLNDKEGEHKGNSNKYRELLSRWSAKQESKYYKEMNEEIKELETIDPIQCVIRNAQRKIDKILEEEDTGRHIYLNTGGCLTKESQNKLGEIKDKRDKKIKELNEKTRDIETLLNLVDNYQEVKEILIGQKIIDESGNILCESLND